jgi:pyrimidine-specific ribonucleoside hydrolase
MTFNQFPTNPNLYSEDMRNMVSKTIERYGIEEWKAGALTHELHGHIGVYAIIGVKMGIVALRTLNVQAGNVSIVSFAGIEPPVSCLNDGLQVSTGATLGHGLIKSEPTDTPQPKAIFTAENKCICMNINKLVSDMITNEIAGAINRWGQTPEYWQYIRRLAIHHWYELDRNNIFEIENI